MKLVAALCHKLFMAKSSSFCVVGKSHMKSDWAVTLITCNYSKYNNDHIYNDDISVSGL